MPQNREMIGEVLKGLGTSPKETIITIPAYDDKKPYRLHIKEVKNIMRQKITIAGKPAKGEKI